ncbi:MAG TPA: helix-turn-helix transcriptional regulator [Candidatus Acidoferrales bacterium]|nr:helix-turn-helix transcriptional regulator [Candidatus Acidoferrales bacterium]
MLIGDRLRELREAKQLSQNDLEKRTGLLRCYISRVENGHTVPAVETLEKFASALQIPMYQIFYEGENPPELMDLPKARNADENSFGSSEKDARWMAKLWRLLGQTSESDRKLLLHVANKMARSKAD